MHPFGSLSNPPSTSVGVAHVNETWQTTYHNILISKIKNLTLYVCTQNLYFAFFETEFIWKMNLNYLPLLAKVFWPLAYFVHQQIFSIHQHLKFKLKQLMKFLLYLTVSVQNIWNKIVSNSLNFIHSIKIRFIQFFWLSQNRSVRINTDDFNSWDELFQNFCSTSNCTTGSGTSDENIDFTFSLFENFASSSVVMSVWVVNIIVLICYRVDNLSR